jgi:hypothetical protein
MEISAAARRARMPPPAPATNIASASLAIASGLVGGARSGIFLQTAAITLQAIGSSRQQCADAPFFSTALERADIETHPCRYDASEHHVSVALWASRAMGVEVDVVGQEIGFLHDASLIEEAGAKHYLSP